jgi:hypothetical protein
MKKMMIIFSALCMFTLGYSQDIASVSDEKPLKKADITFANSTHDFGTIRQNEPVSHSFYLTNTGNAPLIINKVSTSCGCTATEYPKEAILPGKSAAIVITYNAAATGAFSKSATVYHNASDEVTVLKIKGIVQ